jgi:DNA-binding GntR family transcriptional regulator
VVWIRRATWDVPTLEVPVPVPERPPRPPRTLIRDQAYAEIRNAILSGALRPGERLDDAELQRWLGVSRTPVRQALYALSLEGLVETAPQAYTRVVEPHPEEAAQFLQAIGVLVLGHMDLSLPTASDAELDRLIELLHDIHTALVAHDLDRVVAASDAYHRALIALCTNEPLRRLTEQAGVALAYYVTAVYRSLEIDWDAVTGDYALVIDAFRERRFTDAAASVRRLFGIDAERSGPAAAPAVDEDGPRDRG